MLQHGSTFEPGMILDGRVELQELVGTGAMGAVFKAKQQGMERAVAVKVLHQTALFDKEHVARFFREAKVISTMNHPNIVRVYTVGMADNRQPYMVMDYIEAETLADLISTKSLTASEYIEAFIQVASGLAHAHRREIVHRDIKPRNILIQRDPEKNAFNVKIVDFGIARNVVPDTVQRITQTGVIIGSPIYMSPEQCTGRQVDHRTDLYSLGCVMFEAATGAVPFIDKNAAALIGKHVMEPAPSLDGRVVVPDLPPAIAKVVALLLEKKPGDRYPDAETLLQDLEAIKAGQQPPFASNVSTTKESKAKKKGQTAAPVGMQAATTTVIVGSMVTVALFFGVRWATISQERAANVVPPGVLTEINRRCNLANPCMSKHEYDQALNEYSAAYDICMANHVGGKTLADICIARAFCEAQCGNLTRADKFYETAYAYYRGTGDKRVIADISRNWGPVLLSAGYPEKAAPLLAVAWDSLKNGDTETECTAKVVVLRQLCDAYMNAKKPYSAIALFPTLIDLEKTYWPESRGRTHQQYATALRQVGNTEEADKEATLASNFMKDQKLMEDKMVGQ